MTIRLVKPTGPTDSPYLAIVGEAPGVEEAKRGLPFVGNAGHLLDQMLAHVGISRQECYITNVADRRPPDNNFGVFYVDKKRTQPTPLLHEMRGRLKGELHVVQPRVILAMGNEALKALSPYSGIKKHRGCMYDVDILEESMRMLPTIHPASLFHNYVDRPIVELDLAKALRQARRPYKPEMSFGILPDFDTVMQWIELGLSPVAFDIETIGPCTRSLGFAWSPTEAISIPLIRHGTHAWTCEQEQMILQGLNSLLSNPEIEKYLQNAPYDTTVVARELGIHVDGITHDTMYAQHLLYPELPKALDFQSSVYTDFPKYWGRPDQSSDGGNAKYGCYDCCATFIAALKQIRELEQRNLLLFYKRRVHPTIFSLTRMQNRGIKIDAEAKEVERKRLSDELQKNLLALPKLIGYDVNPNSPKQVKALVYDDWGLPKQKKLGTKKVTVEEDALQALARKFPLRRPVLDTILTCRKTNKLISTYIDQELDGGRARTSYGLAKTGRITSSKTIEGFGGNLQNIPRGIFRRLYVADEGKVLIKADLKQAEYRVFCWDAPVFEQINLFLSDPSFDVHTYNTALVYDCAEDKVTKEQRYDVKQVVFASLYAAGALKISRMLDIDFHTAKFILERFKRIRPELEQWWRKVEDDLKTTRTLTNGMGRQRVFFGRMDAATFREGYNWKCQSFVADIINQALNTLDDLGVECLLQVHDELVVQCDDSPWMIKDTVRHVKEAMEIPVRFKGVEQPLTIPVEIAVGHNWYDVKEYDEQAA
jgi:DNA polymerase-1